MSENRQEKIINMFNDISSTYDRANRVLSFGVDTIWRKKACDMAYNIYGDKSLDLIVDVACGTGDMIDYWQKRAEKNSINIKSIKGIDPSSGMLEVAKQKLPSVEFIEAGAENMPLEDGIADIMSISYGIRNVVDREAGLAEFNRVLKKGGLFVILEFSKNEDGGFIPSIRDFYMKNILPVLGGLISKNKDAYTYLPDSIDGFLTQQKLTAELDKAGFDMVYLKGFSMNISSLFIAKKR
jgi:demethylmenaquinone methyltransferase/2-methoxy-6-polyprenyl-1,4-benzoquinol methylase